MSPETTPYAIQQLPDTRVGLMHRMKESVGVRVAVGVLALGGLGAGLSACGSSGPEAAAHNKPAVTASVDPSVEQACGVPMNFSIELANTSFGEPEAIMPSLAKKGNPNELATTATAESLMKKQVAEDPRVAAVFSLLYNIRDGHKPANSLTLQAIAQEYDAMETSESYAASRVEYICQQFNFIAPNSNEAYVGGDAGMVGLTRANGKVTGAEITDITKDRTVQVFELGYDNDNEALSAQDRAYLTEFQQDVAVSIDGDILIKHLSAPRGQQPKPSQATGTTGSTTTTQGAAPKTSVTSPAVTGGGGSKPGSANNSTGGNVGPSKGNAPSFGNTPGNGEHQGPPGPPETGGTTPTTPPETTPPTTSPPETTTPTTSPPETTVPPTTTPPTTTPPTTTPPTTTPPTTTPPTTTPPTTTPPTTVPTKGPDTCNPVFQECPTASVDLVEPASFTTHNSSDGELAYIGLGAALGAAITEVTRRKIKGYRRSH